MIKNLFEKYKNLDFLRRLLLLILISGGIVSYKLWEEYSALEISQEEKNDELRSRKKSLSKVLLEAKRIPKMKASLIRAEVLFEESKKRLPDQFFIDKTLEIISTFAKRTGLNLKLYDPGVPQKEEGSYTFISLPISIILSGKFENIIHFMEEILNLDQLLEIRNYKMELNFPEKSSEKNEEEKSKLQQQESDRNKSEIIFEAELFAFRSLSEQEFKKISKSPSKKNRRKKRREKK